MVFSVFSALFLLSIPAGAQTPNRDVSFALGVSQFDASGTGNAPIAAIRATAPVLGRWILGEISLAYASLDEQFTAGNTRVGILEAQLQGQLPATGFRPYMGLGGGWLHHFNNAAGASAATPTVSGSVGFRARLFAAAVLRGELRLRGWQGRSTSNFVNGAAEFTAGMGFAF